VGAERSRAKHDDPCHRCAVGAATIRSSVEEESVAVMAEQESHPSAIALPSRFHFPHFRHRQGD